MADYPQIRQDLVIVPAEIEGQTIYNIKDPVTESYFRLREPEYWITQQLDGETSPEEIARRFHETFQMEIGADSVRQFIVKLERLYFLDDGRAEHATSRASLQAARGKSLASKLLFIKLKGINPAALLNKLIRVYRPFHNGFWLAVGLVVIMLGLGLFAANAAHFTIGRDQIFQLGSIVLIITTVFATILVHEFAHAVTCRYYGGQVREMGFLLLFFQPCFYADVSDAWLFPKKSQRLAVTWAGPFMQFLVFALAVIVWRVTVPGTFPHQVALIVVLVSGISVLFNFNPLIKLDGYYLLSDWVNIPNLRSRAFAYLGNYFKRAILGWPIQGIDAKRRERRIYLVYAVLATAFSALLIVYILYLVAQFLLAQFGGWGLLVLTLVLLAILKPGIAAMARGAVQHVKYMKVTLMNPVRLTAYIIALVSIGIGLFAVPFPHRVSGEVTVSPINEFALRLNEFGLLERTLQRRGGDPETKTGYVQMVSTEMASLDLIPLVSDGQQVMADDTVALLLSNQVTTELMGAMALLDKYERELELLRSPPKSEAVAEVQSEVSAAKVTLQRLEREFNRVKGLREKDLATMEEYEAAESAVEVARATLRNKEARLDLLKAPPKPEQEAVIRAEIDRQRSRVEFLKTQQDAQSIVAPIGGTIQISPADGRILTILDNRRVETLISVSDFDIDLVRKGQSVLLKVRSFPEELFVGTVSHVPAGAIEVEGQAQFLVSATFDNTHYRLTNGMTGYAKIEIGRNPLAVLLARKVASFIRVEFWSWW